MKTAIVLVTNPPSCQCDICREVAAAMRQRRKPKPKPKREQLRPEFLQRFRDVLH